jgi:formylmethanofuran dehydrogenase subunit E
MTLYICGNCGETIKDDSNPDELQESDLLCSNCYAGYYQLVTESRNTAILHIIS